VNSCLDFNPDLVDAFWLVSTVVEKGYNRHDFLRCDFV